MATASPPSPGQACSQITNLVALPLLCLPWPMATEPSGLPCGRHIRRQRASLLKA